MTMSQKSFNKDRSSLSSYSTDRQSPSTSAGRELSTSQSETRSVEIVGPMLPPLPLKDSGRFSETHMSSSQSKKISTVPTIKPEVVVMEDVSLRPTTLPRPTEPSQLLTTRTKENTTAQTNAPMTPSTEVITRCLSPGSDTSETEIATL